ncbi:MAG: hypothetical protein QM755_06785 [Luteolibacter sp.]
MAGTWSEFSALHPLIRVFPCPQPGHPEAWAVLYEGNAASEDGITAKQYPPHPQETIRRKDWNEALEKDLAPPTWPDGRPWFESVTGFLISPSGKQLGEGFAKDGVLADFDGDGMLDLFEVESGHIKDSKDQESKVDLIGISPLSIRTKEGSNRLRVLCLPCLQELVLYHS